jgi:hypothetical protein
MVLKIEQELIRIKNLIRFGFIEKSNNKYVYNSKEELLSPIKSNLLDVNHVYEDFMNGLTFEEYRNKINNIK